MSASTYPYWHLANKLQKANPNLDWDTANQFAWEIRKAESSRQSNADARTQVIMDKALAYQPTIKL